MEKNIKSTRKLGSTPDAMRYNDASDEWLRFSWSDAER